MTKPDRIDFDFEDIKIINQNSDSIAKGYVENYAASIVCGDIAISNLAESITYLLQQKMEFSNISEDTQLLIVPYTTSKATELVQSHLKENNKTYSIIYAFLEKHSMELIDVIIHDDWGVVVHASDYYFDEQDIMYDIENDISEGMIFKYYDHIIESENRKLSYQQYLKNIGYEKD